MCGPTWAASTVALEEFGTSAASPSPSSDSRQNLSLCSKESLKSQWHGNVNSHSSQGGVTLKTHYLSTYMGMALTFQLSRKHGYFSGAGKWIYFQNEPPFLKGSLEEKECWSSLNMYLAPRLWLKGRNKFFEGELKLAVCKNQNKRNVDSQAERWM